jgi:hypothetical protein
MLTAFAAAAQHSPAAYSQELFAAATEFLWEGLGQLEPCGLADVAAAYAAVQHYDDDEDFFNGVAAAALQRLQVGSCCTVLHGNGVWDSALPQRHQHLCCVNHILTALEPPPSNALAIFC